MGTNAMADNVELPETGSNAEPAKPVEADDNAKLVRRLADFIHANRHELKAAGKSAPDNWQDYVLGQTKRALAIEDSDKLRALIVEALASIGPRDAVEDMIAAQMLVCHDAAMECFAAQAPDKKNCSHEESFTTGCNTSSWEAGCTRVRHAARRTQLPSRSATKSLAIEYAKRGIRVNAVALGTIKTPMHPAESHEVLGALHPIGHMGEIADVVDAILYLESAHFVTGEILHVDGGQSAGH
jgi:NAD(P)-dependent dehydrogenase (short-subunit alcohol dehydrogenase family)